MRKDLPASDITSSKASVVFAVTVFGSLAVQSTVLPNIMQIYVKELLQLELSPDDASLKN